MLILIGTRIAFSEIPAVAFYLAANDALGISYDLLNISSAVAAVDEADHRLNTLGEKTSPFSRVKAARRVIRLDKNLYQANRPDRFSFLRYVVSS